MNILHCFLLLISAVCIGLPAHAASSQEQSQSAQLMAEARNMLVHKLRDHKILEDEAAERLLNLPVISNDREPGMSAAFEDGKIVFCVSDKLDGKTLKNLAHQQHTSTTEILVPMVGNALGQADILCHMQHETTARLLPIRTLRGYALAFEVTTFNLLFNKNLTFAEYAPNESSLIDYLTKEEGKYLFFKEGGKNLYRPNRKDLHDIKTKLERLSQPAADAPRSGMSWVEGLTPFFVWYFIFTIPVFVFTLYRKRRIAQPRPSTDSKPANSPFWPEVIMCIGIMSILVLIASYALDFTIKEIAEWLIVSSLGCCTGRFFTGIIPTKSQHTA